MEVDGVVVFPGLAAAGAGRGAAVPFVRLWGWVAPCGFDRLSAVDAGWKPALRGVRCGGGWGGGVPWPCGRGCRPGGGCSFFSAVGVGW